MSDKVTMTRRMRLIAAAGEDGGPPPPAAVARVTEKLTYYERKYDFQAARNGGPAYSYHKRVMYSVDPASGAVVFPLGLRSRVAADLLDGGFAVAYNSPSLAHDNLAVHGVDTLDWDGLFSEFEIHTGQDAALASIVAADGGVIDAATGFGKSVIMRMLCRLYHKARIHIVTRMTTLAKEIYHDLRKVIPDVGFVGGGKRDLRRVTVFVADSLQHGMGDADIVLADEGHELVAPKYAQLLGRYDKARMFTFTASPEGRADRRDIELEALFGPVLFRMEYGEAQALGNVVPITVEWVTPATGPDLTDITQATERDRVGIWHNAIRNEAIAKRAAAFDADEQVMIMVKTIEHAVRLKALLPDFTLCHAANGMKPERLEQYVAAGLLPAGEPRMTKDRLELLRKQFAANSLKKVIANYVWSTGVNFRHLGVLIRADAASVKTRDIQIPGRICRRVPGSKESALLIDVWDSWNQTYENKSRSRRRNYLAKGWAEIGLTPPTVANAG